MERKSTVSALIRAHNGTGDRVNPKYEYSYCQELSVMLFVRSPENVMKALEHSHEEYEFIMPLTPIPFLVAKNAVYFGESGAVFPVISGRTHGIKYDIADVSYISITVQKQFFESLITEKGVDDGALFNSPFRSSDELLTYISAFRAEFSKGLGCYKPKLQWLSKLICCEIIDISLTIDDDMRRGESEYQRGIRSAAVFLNNNFDKPVTIQEAAAVCGLSQNYFSCCFKKMYGDTPQEYLTRLRISKAKILLETTGLPIGEVAVSCGYRLSSAFSQAFSAMVGLSPSAYRKSH